MDELKQKKDADVLSHRIVVLGAGVAGMTAAHELAERGYKVVVHEAQVDPRTATEPLLGGLAATQWARLPIFEDGHSSRSAYNVLRNKTVEAARPRDLLATADGLPQPHDPRRIDRWPRIDLPHGKLDEAALGLLRTVAQNIAAQWIRRPLPEDIWVGGALSRSEAKAAQEKGVASKMALDRARLAATTFQAFLEAALDHEIQRAGTLPYRMKAQPIGRAVNQREIVTTIKPDAGEGPEIRVTIFDLGEAAALVPDDADATAEERPACVVVRLAEQLLPGEHGYRFFPSFYRHVFDTMRRTPILRERRINRLDLAFADDFDDPSRFVRSYEADAFTIFDNLRSIDRHAFANADGRPPIELPRTAAASLTGSRKLLDAFQERMGLEVRDLVRAQLKLVRFLLTSDARRRELEHVSWEAYVGADVASQAFRDALRTWPQALVGLRSGEADTRAFGNAAAQLALDQMRPGELRDATLVGPTTTAWMDPWRRYLEKHFGVEFRVGRVTGLELVDDQLHPTLDVAPTYDATTRYVFALSLLEAVQLGATLAVSTLRAFPDATKASPSSRKTTATRSMTLRALERVETTYEDAGKPVPADLKAALDRWRALRDAPLWSAVCLAWGDGDPGTGAVDLVAGKTLQELLDELPGRTDDYLARARGAAPKTGAPEARPEVGPHRHFVGVQFFLAEDFEAIRGHVYYPDSRWRLSSISPHQFRRERPSRADRYNGFVSVIVGAFDVPGSGGKPVWACTKDEFVAEVWKQLTDAYRGARVQPPSRPLAFHVDEAMVWSGDDASPVHGIAPIGSGAAGGEHLHRNATPHLANLVGLADWWPERPGDYRVHFGNTVFCGTWLRTCTRIVTMEAANESARHAVNALLDVLETADANVRSARCEIFDPGDHEIEDLGWFKRLDAELHARNLPHVFDILGFEAFWLDQFGDGTTARASSLSGAMADAVRGSFQLGSGVRDALVRVVRRLMADLGSS